MKKPDKIFKLTDLNWLFSKKEGTVEPILTYDKGVYISVFSGNVLKEVNEMIESDKLETDSLMILDSFNAVEKYATRTLNSYSLNKYLFLDSEYGTSLDWYVNDKTLTLKELEKLTQTMTKAYQKDYQKIDLSRVNWLVDSKDLSVEPFAFSLDSGVAYSLMSGEVMKKLEEVKNNTNSQAEVLTSYEAIVRYAMHKPNRYSFEEKVLEDGLYVEGRLVTAEHLKKLTALLKEGLEIEAQKTQLNQQ